MELLLSSELWMALLALTTLEIVLGVDNLVFISIAVSRLAPEQRPRARRLGLGFACITRILLLLSLAYLARMDTPLIVLLDNAISVRDLVLIAGGLFLLVKGTLEIHDSVEGRGEDEDIDTRPSAVFAWVIVQIAVIDIVFSLDSVITAVGMVNYVPVMVAAIVKILALAFLILVGMALIADGLDYHIPRGYLYFAMAFSGVVEALNIAAGARRRARSDT